MATIVARMLAGGSNAGWMPYHNPVNGNTRVYAYFCGGMGLGVPAISHFADDLMAVPPARHNIFGIINFLGPAEVAATMARLFNIDFIPAVHAAAGLPWLRPGPWPGAGAPPAAPQLPLFVPLLWAGNGVGPPPLVNALNSSLPAPGQPAGAGFAAAATVPITADYGPIVNASRPAMQGFLGVGGTALTLGNSGPSTSCLY